MIADVELGLNAVLSSAVTLRQAGGAGRIFELFVMTSVACELKARGYGVWIQRSDGTRVNLRDRDRRFIQRGGAPTGVAGASQGVNNASSIGFQSRCGAAWEISGTVFDSSGGAVRHTRLI